MTQTTEKACCLGQLAKNITKLNQRETLDAHRSHWVKDQVMADKKGSGKSGWFVSWAGVSSVRNN